MYDNRLNNGLIYATLDCFEAKASRNDEPAENSSLRGAESAEAVQGHIPQGSGE